MPVLVLAVVGGAVAFSFMRKKPMMDGEKPMLGRRMMVNEDNGGQGVGEMIEDNIEFANIWQNRQGSYKCEMESEDLNYTYYFDNDRMAIDMTVEGQSGHVIWTGEYMYNWNDETKQGMKMTYNLEEMGEDMMGFDPDEYEEEIAQAEEMAEKMGIEEEEEFEMPKIKCQKWRVDNKKFELPSDVNFQDLSQMQMYMEE